MSEPAQKCENLAIFKQNYTLELFIAYGCCLGLRGNLDFPDFLPKSFITSNTGLIERLLHGHLHDAGWGDPIAANT